ncbi:MAG: hypothetical protein AAFV25_16220, partial [Bacteroidota bacterium]
ADIDQAPIDPKEKPLFQYLKKLTLHPSKLVQEDAQKVFEAGWREEDLQDVILIACLFNFYNRLLDGHGIKGNPAIYQFGADHLHKSGYGVPWFINLIKGSIRKMKRKQLQSNQAST